MEIDGNIMKAVREKRGATGEQFAAMLNQRLSRRYDKAKISRWESGGEAIPPDVAGVIALWRLSYERTGKPVITAVALQKGGTGKSTTTIGLAFVLAIAGARVLIVDNDSQGNATLHTGFTESSIAKLAKEGRTLHHTLLGETETRKAISRTSIANLDILPASIHLAVAEMKLANGTGDEAKLRLKQVIADVRDDYDFVVIDTGPSLGLLTLSALAAAHRVLIPVQTESFAITGFHHLIDTVDDVRKRLNNGLQVLGILPTMYSARQSQDRESLDEIRKKAGSAVRVFEPIPKSTIYAQAAAGRRIPHDVDPGAPGLSSYIAIAECLGVQNG